MKEILRYLEERGVNYLVHFTPLSNLEQIKSKGIVPRRELEASDDTQFMALDELRLDRRKDMSCFSFSFPNFKMMYRYREKLIKNGSDIALLFIPISQLSYLSEEQMLFYPTNAASSLSISMRVEDLRGLPAVQAMFAEEAQTKSGQVFSRSAVKLPSCLTTDPQAEVQIAATIPWAAVSFIAVKGYERRTQLRESGLHPKIYGTWRVNDDRQLNVFNIPDAWKAWVEKTEVSNGE